MPFKKCKQGKFSTSIREFEMYLLKKSYSENEIKTKPEFIEK